MNENFESAGDGLLPKSGGSNPEYLEKSPDNQSENRYHIYRGKNSSPQPGIEPLPSDIGDKFAWSERRL